jgi:type I restriction enzyme R subunit
VVSFAESVVEDAALAWLESLGYSVLHGPDIAARRRDRGGQAASG